MKRTRNTMSVAVVLTAFLFPVVASAEGHECTPKRFAASWVSGALVGSQSSTLVCEVVNHGNEPIYLKFYLKRRGGANVRPPAWRTIPPTQSRFIEYAVPNGQSLAAYCVVEENLEVNGNDLWICDAEQFRRNMPMNISGNLRNDQNAQDGGDSSTYALTELRERHDGEPMRRKIEKCEDAGLELVEGGPEYESCAPVIDFVCPCAEPK